MKIFLSLTNSAKQALGLHNFLLSLNSNYLNICVVFDLTDQTSTSNSQYREILAKLDKKKTIYLKEKYYSPLHNLCRMITRKSSLVTVVLGSILGVYCRGYFEDISKCQKIILDDGLISVSVAKLLFETGRWSQFQLVTSYASLLDSNPQILETSSSTWLSPNSIISSKVQTLGVFGSPLVESGFLSLSELEDLLEKATVANRCSRIFYYMHRREISKFTSEYISEIVSNNSDSLDIILGSSSIPAKWWSVYSSALVDLSLMGIPNLVYSYTPIKNIPEMNNPYIASLGISTVSNIYDIYSALGFKEI